MPISGYRRLALLPQTVSILMRQVIRISLLPPRRSSLPLMLLGRRRHCRRQTSLYLPAQRPMTLLRRRLVQARLHFLSDSQSFAVQGLGGSSYPMTVECYFKGTVKSNFANIFGVGQATLSQGSGTTNGYFNVRQGSGTQQTSTTTITDGNWHHLAYTDTGAAQVLYVDGTSVKTASTTENNAALNNISAFIAGEVASELDECAYWNTIHYTANFTPPTSAYVGNEAGLIAVWHFDSTLAGHSGPVLVPNQAPSPPTPVISSLTCSASLPVTASTNLSPTCQATALCNSAPCTGSNAITNWTLTTQSNASFFTSPMQVYFRAAALRRL